MDPNECLKRIDYHLSWGVTDQALDACYNLNWWLHVNPDREPDWAAYPRATKFFREVDPVIDPSDWPEVCGE